MNNILKTPFSFHLLNSNFSKWEYRKVEKNSFLIVLREMDLTEKDTFSAALLAGPTSIAQDALAPVARALVVAFAADIGIGIAGAYWKIYDQAKEENEKTGKIKGFEVLNIQTREKLWLSHYVMELVKCTQ